jgi:hypothetical protein
MTIGLQSPQCQRPPPSDGGESGESGDAGGAAPPPKRRRERTQTVYELIEESVLSINEDSLRPFGTLRARRPGPATRTPTASAACSAAWWPEAEEVTRKALRALATAHALGVVHGDLKPDHIAVLYPGCAQSMSDIAPCMPGEEEEHGAMEVRLVDWDSSVWRRGDGSVARGPRGATRGFEAPELRESRQASEAGAQRGAHGGRPVQGARSPGRRCARGALHPSGGAARAWEVAAPVPAPAEAEAEAEVEAEAGSAEAGASSSESPAGPPHKLARVDAGEPRGV